MKARYRHRTALLGVVALLLLSLILVPAPDPLGAASHRDAPLITEDPAADNTDVYAFVSPADPDKITLIANYYPFENPSDGPNFYRFSDQVLYEIKVDVTGNGQEDLTYQFRFKTKQPALADIFLYNVGPIGVPAATCGQYSNLNVQQSYTVTEIRGSRRRGEKEILSRSVCPQGLRVAPINVGPKSLATSYANLANAAIHTLPGDIRVFAGPRDDGFYADLGAIFDLVNIRNPGVDSLAGFNVHSIAIEIPKSRFAAAGANGIIGVWATASRRKVTVLRADEERQNRGDQDEEEGDNPWVQVSRLGNPLVNEVLIPLSKKDFFNATAPKDDGVNFANFIVNPGPTSLAGVLSGILVGTGCTGANAVPVFNRTDLRLALLTGIPRGTLGFPGNVLGTVEADMLRLNYTVGPAPRPSPLGLFGGDPIAWPNGRRVGDNVVDIALRAVGGGVLHALGAINCPAATTLSDNVPTNDVPYLTTFPYLAPPHPGR